MSANIEDRLGDSSPDVAVVDTASPDVADANIPNQGPDAAQNEALRARLNKSEKLLQEAAEQGGNVPQENAGLFRVLLQFLLRIKARISNMLHGNVGPNEYSRAADELDGAQTPQQMADIAKKASLSAKTDKNAVAQMTDEALQSKVAALLQAHCGLDGAEAALYATLASSQYKPSPEQEDIIAAALESQAQAIGVLSAMRQSLLEQIRQALRVRGGVAFDVEKMDLRLLESLAKEKNLADVIKLCQHCQREDGELKSLKMAATTTYEHAWLSMMPMDRVQGAANRIWSAEEQEKMRYALAQKHPDVSTVKESLERSQLASQHLSTDKRRQAAAGSSLSSAHNMRAQMLTAAGKGRVLGADGKPLSDIERSNAQKAAQDAITKAKGASSADTVPTISAAAAIVAPVGASAALNLAKLRANAQAGLSPDVISRPMPTESDLHSQADATVRAFAARAGHINPEGAMGDVQDDDAPHPLDVPKPD